MFLIKEVAKLRMETRRLKLKVNDLEVAKQLYRPQSGGKK